MIDSYLLTLSLTNNDRIGHLEARDEPMSPAENLKKEAASVDEKEPPKTVSARELFGNAREIWIEHEGTRYVLRITRRGKLILQK